MGRLKHSSILILTEVAGGTSSQDAQRQPYIRLGATMGRKIIVNLLVGFIALPLVSSYIYWKRIITHDYSIEDAHYNSLSEFVVVIMHQIGVPYSSIIYLILAMGPFQFIKDYYFYSRKKGLSFIIKALTLSLITMFLWFLALARFSRVEEMTLEMFIFPVSVGIILSFLLHVFLDRYIENETIKKTN